MGLVALGWANGKIAQRLVLNSGTVSNRILEIVKKTGVASRIGLALFYVDHVLATDILPDYQQPGEKLAEWQSMARRRREELRRVGELTPRVVEAVMLVSRPEYASMSDGQLAAKMTGTPITPATFAGYIRSLARTLPNGGRLKLAVIARLAPLTDEPEETL
jgi:hypothetical protein